MQTTPSQSKPLIPPHLVKAPIETLELIEKIKQRKVEEAKILAAYKRANPIEFFSPNPPQLDALIAYINPVYRTFTYTGGNRRGKTTIGCHLAIINMIGYIPYKLECVNNDGEVLRSWESVYEEIKEWEGKTWNLIWRNGNPLVELIFNHTTPRQIRYIGQGWEDHVRDVVILALHKWWPANRKVQIKKNQIGLEVYWTDIKSGSYLRIMSNDQPTSKFEGKDDDLVIADEPLKKDNYIALRRGLVDRDGKAFFAMTLLMTEMWIDRLIIKRVLDDGRPDPSVYNSDGTIYDNLGFGLKSKIAIDNFADEILKLDPAHYDARIKGIPGYLAGIIYGIFNRKTHIKRKFRVPLDWIVDISIDPHPKECQAVLFLATNPRNEKYVIDEIWAHADPKSLAEMILTKIHQNYYRVENPWLIDPHSKGDSNNPESTYEKIENVIAPYRYSLEPAQKGIDCVNDGIIVVKDWLMTQNMEAALFFFDSVVRTIYEVEGWMWNPKTGKPVDKDDHMMENLRRLIALGTKWREKRKKVSQGVPVDWRLV
jgi:hypothetical protein